MVKGRRFRLVYSHRWPFDERPFGQTALGGDSVYSPSPFEVLITRMLAEKAKKRIKLSKRNKFNYNPSKTYERAWKRFLMGEILHRVEEPLKKTQNEANIKCAAR